MTAATFGAATPEPHRRFLERAIESLREDRRIVGVAAGGSYLTGTMDEFSDLDLVLAIEQEHFDALFAVRAELAAGLGELLAAFTGEHVGEPHLLICLYGPPPLHVDLKFCRLADLASRNEEPLVLWERDERMSGALAGSAPRPIGHDPQWIEDRFWVWVHYAATKLGRGELFELVDFLSFLRVTALGPLGLRRAGARPTGVRRIEALAPELADELRGTVAGYHALDAARALRACIATYRSLRDQDASLEIRADAEREAVRYLDEIEDALRAADNAD